MVVPTQLEASYFWKTWSRHQVRCLVVLHERDAPKVSAIKRFFHAEGILCAIRLSSTDIYEKRYYELIWDMWALLKDEKKSNPDLETKWFAVGDDDTLWFLENLLIHLEPLRHTEPIYLGDISESLSARQSYGSDFAYGGGGVILSQELISRLEKTSRNCDIKNTGIGGDAILGQCIRKLNLYLTRNSYFHQMDFYMDAT